MKSIHALLFNLLIGLNTFILFLLLFETRIVVPPVLQVVGRMHPLLLHFPIVLLVLAWLFAFFGRRWAFPWPVVKRLVYFLLFASAWSAAITVVAGLFLAREGSYGGDRFEWHKWTGVALCFLSAVLVWNHRHAVSRSERYRPLFLAGLSCAVAVLLVVGHFGASLTHGAEYLLEPVRKDRHQVLDIETAIVYTDLVYPILQAKCISCHSPNKSRGGLVLADTLSLLRGGESGPAMVKGSTEASLIVERLLLDINHEHRMPPKDKPQLTPEELSLIEAWIISGASFTRPLADLPMGDTIHYLAEAIYGPPAKPQYDFPAADSEAIERLNTPYRAVRPVAQSSPALNVSFYGRTFYSSSALAELSSVSLQVVSLNLNGMPLSPTDMEVLGTFVNLRELSLNDTPIDDTWADVLAGLPAVRHISLSGTNLTEEGLSKILDSSTLRAVYVWNTAIPAEVLDEMQGNHQAIRIERGYVDDGSEVLPLNNPQITPASSFFRDEIQVTLSHPISGVELRYTLDGSEPDSINSLVYDGPMMVESATVIKAKAYKEGWLASGEVVRSFHRSRFNPTHVVLATPPHPRYRGRETLALFDMESGSDNHADGKWLGFFGERMEVSMQFDTAIRVDTVGLHVKQNYGPHIYPPRVIEIWGGADSSSARLLSRFRPDLAKPDQATGRRMIHIALRADNVGYLRMVAEPIKPIPAGYPGASNPAWIFVDEIVLY